MATHNDTGRKGELLAAYWLIEQGYQIMFKNWRYRHGEIDIIARKKGVLHFIEVKTSRTNTFGFPEERINRRKWRSLKNSSMAFLEGFGEDAIFQFDIISVSFEFKSVKYYFIDDAFS
ncbi:MAG TPA: YraN family protein [Puia sp.]|jgi:putative endonuclease|nr:YraN family protein [Puia sp.]